MSFTVEDWQRARELLDVMSQVVGRIADEVFVTCPKCSGEWLDPDPPHHIECTCSNGPKPGYQVRGAKCVRCGDKRRLCVWEGEYYCYPHYREVRGWEK